MSADIEAEHESLLQFLYLCPVGIVQINSHGLIDLANPAATRLLMPIAQTPQLVNLFDVLGGVMPELRSLSNAMERKRGVVCQSQEIDLGRDTASGRWDCWVSLSLLRIGPEKQMAVLHDITELVQEREAHQWKSAYLNTIFRGVKDYAIFTLDSTGHVEGWNESVEHLLAFGCEDTVGQPFSKLWVEQEGHTMSAQTLLEIARQSGTAGASGWQFREDGSSYWADCIISALKAKDTRHQSYSVIMRDMTEWKLAEERMVELATTDFLTGLTNRRSFLQRADDNIREARSKRLPSVLAMVDIDGLRTVNETLGHKKGDEVIKAVGQILTREIQDGTIVGRISGEEFVFLSVGETADTAKNTMLRVQEAATALDLGIPVSVTVGIGEISDPNDGTDVLIKRAETALAAAKSRGSNQIAHFDPALDDVANNASAA